jgi:hypothetical protein
MELVGWSAFAFTNAEDPPVVVDDYARNRQSAVVTDANLWWLSNTDLQSAAPAGRYVFVRPFMQGYNAATAKVGLHAGDFGSPLFYYATGAATARRVVGIATTIGASLEKRTVRAIPGTDCSDGRCDVWVDVTRPAVAKWIADNAADKSRDALPNWNRAHPRADGRVRAGGIPDWWLGESDANGACDPSKDADCDGWNDKNADGSPRDNCPNVANADQRDANDDGEGDACIVECHTTADCRKVTCGCACRAEPVDEAGVCSGPRNPICPTAPIGCSAKRAACSAGKCVLVSSGGADR